MQNPANGDQHDDLMLQTVSCWLACLSVLYIICNRRLALQALELIICTVHQVAIVSSSFVSGQVRFNMQC